jgi:hypothetical protein
MPDYYFCALQVNPLIYEVDQPQVDVSCASQCIAYLFAFSTGTFAETASANVLPSGETEHAEYKLTLSNYSTQRLHAIDVNNNAPN